MVASLIFVFAVLPLTFATIGAENNASLPHAQESYHCLLPPYPEHGRYIVKNYPYATPGERYPSVMLDITCDTGYLNNNTIKSIFCVNGDWSSTIPICVHDFQECGLTTQQQLDSTSSNQLQLPWHAVIYQKGVEDYYSRCGGSLISATKMISAARCSHYYDNDVLRRPSDFVATVNKMFLRFKDARDRNRQVSDVIDIIFPSSYQGRLTHYENNIAIVIVRTPFFFHQSVRPVCLDFDNNLSTQLTEGNSGKTVRWITAGDKKHSFEVLNVLDYTAWEKEDCENMLHDYQRKYLTKDKFCTRQKDTDYAIIDTGTGLVDFDSTSQRYYLRGVYSETDLATDRNTWVTMYTSIVKHKDFIKQHL